MKQMYILSLFIAVLLTIVLSCKPGQVYNPANPSSSDGLEQVFSAIIAQISATPPKLRTFLSTAVPGGFGGPGGADAICNNDPNRPAGGAFKAFLGAYNYTYLGANIVIRMFTLPTATPPITAVDWALKPNTDYYQKDGTTLVGTTDANGIFSAPLQTPLCGAAPGTFAWTGFSSNPFTFSSNSCNFAANNSLGTYTDWTDSANGTGVTMDLGATLLSSASFSSPTCLTPNPICCVEQ